MRNQTALIVLAGTLVLLMFPVESDCKSPHKASWPMFGGSAQRTFQGEELPLSSPPKLSWGRAVVGEKEEIVDIVANEEAAFVLARLKPDRFNTLIEPTQGFVFAIRLSDGKKIWTCPSSGLLYAGIWETRIPMVLSHDRLYVASLDGVLALDPRTGKRIWQKEKKWGDLKGSISLLDDGKRLFIGLPGDREESQKARVLALDANGNKLWGSDLELDGNLLLTLQKEVLLVSSNTDTHILALRSDNGAILWRKTIPPIVVGSESFPAVIFPFHVPHGQDEIFLFVEMPPPMTMPGRPISWVTAVESKSGDLAWKTELKRSEQTCGGLASDGSNAYVLISTSRNPRSLQTRILCIDLKSGKRKWISSKLHWSMSWPVISGKVLIHAAMSRLECVSSENGEKLWSLGFAREPFRPDFWRVLIAGGRIIVSHSKSIWVLKPEEATSNKQNSAKSEGSAIADQ